MNWKDFWHKYQEWIIALGVVVIGLLSYAIIADSALVVNLNATSIAALDEKKETVLALTTLAGGTSTAITLIPGDVATPLAEKLTDLVDYLLIVYASIWLQKYLLSITGLVAFKFLVPLACGILAISRFTIREKLQALAVRLLLFAALLFTCIPTSVWVTHQIESTYQSSITEIVETAESANDKATKDSSLWEQLTGGAKNILESFQTVLGNMVDAVTVFIVTTCIIPLLVFLFFIWGIRLIFQLDIGLHLPRNPHFFAKVNQALKSRTEGQ